jgi:hypothetical protein
VTSIVAAAAAAVIRANFCLSIVPSKCPDELQAQGQGTEFASQTAAGGYMVFTAASLSPVLAILFGILIFVFPKLLNYLVATYLVLSGLIGLGVLSFRV